MGKHLAIVVDWFGPFSAEEARDKSREFGPGLYVAIGKTRGQRTASKLQYIGLSGDLPTRFAGPHHKLSLVTREREIWLGEIVSADIPGPRQRFTDRLLDTVESAHIFFLNPYGQFPLNQRKVFKPPTSSATITNRWWTKDSLPRQKRPHGEWPMLIDYRGYDFGARLYWGASWEQVDVN